ncbi:hypothetical protein D3C76_1423950 [compost metagenome]
MNSAIPGSSQKLAMAMLALMVTVGLLSFSMVSTVLRSSARLRSIPPSKVRPALVRSRALCVRVNSCTPMLSSRCLIWRLTALCDKLISSAARVKLRCRAAASKASRFCSGGSRLRGMLMASLV